MADRGTADDRGDGGISGHNYCAASSSSDVSKQEADGSASSTVDDAGNKRPEQTTTASELGVNVKTESDSQKQGHYSVRALEGSFTVEHTSFIIRERLAVESTAGVGSVTGMWEKIRNKFATQYSEKGSVTAAQVQGRYSMVLHQCRRIARKQDHPAKGAVIWQYYELLRDFIAAVHDHRASKRARLSDDHGSSHPGPTSETSVEKPPVVEEVKNEEEETPKTSLAPNDSEAKASDVCPQNGAVETSIEMELCLDELLTSIGMELCLDELTTSSADDISDESIILPKGVHFTPGGLQFIREGAVRSGVSVQEFVELVTPFMTSGAMDESASDHILYQKAVENGGTLRGLGSDYDFDDVDIIGNKSE